LKPTSSNFVTPAGPQPAEEYTLPPVWLQRLAVAVYVLFCMTLGMALVTLPWIGNWFEDGLVARWPALQHLLQQGFVRGAVSGLGLIDIWLGIIEAVRYQDRRPQSPTTTNVDGNTPC
jgi:hypothetical protein